MPTKKRKYNARFPAGRIKKIMQTDEEVGKVAQAVPIIISRTLELFVESLLNKALQVTVNRNAKTLSPSHVKQCILAEAKFDFLRDLVKNIPDVSAAEEKELQMSAESSPNCSRFSEQPIPPRKIVREDSNSSSSSDIRLSQITLPRTLSSDKDKVRCETITSASAGAIDLTVKTEDHRPIRTANFYHETLPEDPPQSVIKINPSYSSPQPSTSSYTTFTSIEVPRIKIPMPKPETGFFVKNSHPKTPTTPITPIINIDFTKNLGKPEIKVLDNVAAGIVGVKNERTQKLQRQNSKNFKEKKVEVKTPPILSSPVDIDRINYSNLEIDEDYDT